MKWLGRGWLVLVVAWSVGAVMAADGPQVAVSDTGPSTHASTWECQSGHPVLTREVSLSSPTITYAFRYTGCQSPDHGDEHPASEGNFGMPQPVSANFYHSGFLNIIINGKDALRYTLESLDTLDTGKRGSFQALFAHPDARVGLRFMLLPGSNHVMMELHWQPRDGKTIDQVQVQITCYPSFFTSFNARQGDRHCMTPRTDQAEASTLALSPAEDSWLYYYDRVFDRARGEGEGPCAVLLDAAPVRSGQVQITNYPVVTLLDLDPAAGDARLSLYDFAGQTNAQAEAYLRTRGVADLRALQAADLSPSSVRGLDLAALRAELEGLVAAGREDGEALRPAVEGLLGSLARLQANAGAGDWAAEAALVRELSASEDLVWRLRIFAAINRPAG